MAQAIRRNQLIAVAYIDIDGFKLVNDSFGHSVGDKLLVALAEKMTKSLRKSDTISRVGGDEFIALYMDVLNEESVAPLLIKLLDALCEAMIIDSHPIDISASVGVSFYPQKEELEMAQLIRQADQAMYRAKKSGKNRYVVFEARHDDFPRD